MKKFQIKRNQKGYTLLEFGLVSLIIAFLGGLAYIGYNTQRADTLADRETQDVQAYLGKIAKFYVTDPDYSNADLPTLIAKNVFPLVSGTQVKNRFGGLVTIAPTQINSTNDSLAVTSTQYTKDACMTVGADVGNNLLTLQVNGTPVKQMNAALDKKALGTACTASSTMIYTIGK